MFLQRDTLRATELMKLFFPILLLAFLSGRAVALDFQNPANPFVTQTDVRWTTLGTNENDSMPIGNGDLAANVWTEQNGDLVLLVAKADAWTEWGKLVKLGRVRVQLSPNPFVNAPDFTQTLHLENGSVEIKSGKNILKVWADANRPAIHVEAELEHPATLQAKLELWRTTKLDRGGMFELSGPISLKTAADTVFPAQKNQITWCHFNPDSIYPIVLQEEHLDSLLPKYPDPLLHRCFGAALTGPYLASPDEPPAKPPAPAKFQRSMAGTLAMVESILESQLDSRQRNCGRGKSFARLRHAALYDGVFVARRVPREIQRRTVHRRPRLAGSKKFQQRKP